METGNNFALASPYLSIEEAAAYMRMHPESLRKLCRLKDPPINFVRNGRRYLFDRDLHLDPYLKHQGSAAMRKQASKALKSL